MPSSNAYPSFDRPERIANIWVQAWNRRDAIRRAHDYGLRTIFDQPIVSLVTRRVRWLVGGPDGDSAVAVVHARMELEGQTAVADVNDPRRTIFTLVVRRTDAGWRCASAQNTDVVPGAETNVIDDQGRMRSVSYRPGGRADRE